MPQVRQRNAAVPLRGYRLDQQRRATATEILVDFYCAEDVDDLRIWTTIAARLRVKLGTGSYYPVGASFETSASLGSFSAGETKQGTLEVVVPSGVATRHEELEVLLGYGDPRQPVSFLLFDDFLTNESAPLTSPRTCEPGPGTWNVTQPNNEISIVSGELEFAQATDYSGILRTLADLGTDNDAGKCFHGRIVSVDAGTTAVLALHHAATVGSAGRTYFLFRPGIIQGIYDPTVGWVTLAQSWTYPIPAQIISRSVGSYAVASGKLLWVFNSQQTAVSLMVAHYNTSGSWDDVRYIDLPGEGYPEWGPDFSTLTSGGTAVHMDLFDLDSDFEDTHSFTWLTGLYCNCIFRRSDASHYLVASAYPDGSLRLMKEDGGTLGLGQVNGLFSNGISYEMTTVCRGDSIKIYVDNVLEIDVTNSFNQDVAQGVHWFSVTGTVTWEAHPHPALGIATDRLVCPQSQEEFTMNSVAGLGMVFNLRTLVMPTGSSRNVYVNRHDDTHSLSIIVYPTGDIRLFCYDADNGNATIFFAAAATSADDDISLFLYGEGDTYYAALYVNATNIGGPSDITSYITGLGGPIASGRNGANTLRADAFEIFPRYVAGLLPGDVL